MRTPSIGLPGHARRTTPPTPRPRSLAVRVSLVLVLAAAPGAVRAAPAPADAPRVLVAPDPRARADLTRRLLLGEGWRRLWITPVSAPELEPAAWAGGAAPLDPADPARALLLTGADSSRALFRPLAASPPPPGGLDPGAIAMNWLDRDRLSVWHPAGRMVAGALMRAAGVRADAPRLVAFPADTSAGPAAAPFTGRLGTLESLPRAAGPGDAGDPPGTLACATTTELVARLAGGHADRVDARAYLAARLMAFVLDDASASPMAWTWIARADGGRRVWRPAPALPVRAFPRSGGLLQQLPREALPTRRGRPVVTAPDGAADSIGAADALDRLVLAELDGEAWAAVVADLVGRLGDDAIDSAVAAMPPEMLDASAGELSAGLERRRDGLDRFAASEYARLSQAVDVRTTLGGDSVVVARPDARHLDVAVFARGAGAGDTPWFRRRFDAAETREVRLDLMGAHDRVVAVAGVTSPITLRIVARGGSAEVDPALAAAGARLYSAGAVLRVAGDTGARVEPLVDPREPHEAAALSGWARDFGARSGWDRTIEPSSDRGLLVGGRFDRETYGFEQRPFASRTSFGARWSLSEGAGELDAGHQVHRANSRLSAGADVHVSGLDVSRFYGFGNTTPDTSGWRDAYDVHQTTVRLEPYGEMRLSPRARLRLSAPVEFVHTGAQAPHSVLAALRPFGMGDVHEAGGRMRLIYGPDPATSEAHPSPAEMQGRVTVSHFAIAEPRSAGFGSVAGDVTTRFRFSCDAAPRLTLRAGGQRDWGRYPFFEAAFLGGSGLLPGTREQRYAGDASLYGESELRFTLLRKRRWLPGDLGMLGIADAGRVYLEGEFAPLWHGVSGGGFWFSPRGARDSFSLLLVNGEGHTRVSTRGGFSF